MQKIKLPTMLVRFGIGFILVSSSTFSLAHYFATRSEAFQKAEIFISSANKVSDLIGPVVSVHLPWFDEFSIEESEKGGQRDGKAFFTLVAKGRDREVKMYVVLEIESNVWIVKSVSILDHT